MLSAHFLLHALKHIMMKKKELACRKKKKKNLTKQNLMQVILNERVTQSNNKKIL